MSLYQKIDLLENITKLYEVLIMREKILLFIQKEIKEISQIDQEISEESYLRETPGKEYLDVASLELAELLVCLEDHYNIEISIQEITSIETVGEMISTILKKIDEREDKEIRIQEIEDKLFHSFFVLGERYEMVKV